MTLGNISANVIRLLELKLKWFITLVEIYLLEIFINPFSLYEINYKSLYLLGNIYVNPFTLYGSNYKSLYLLEIYLRM